MNVYSFNFQPQNIWTNIDRTRQFKVEGMTAEEWVAAGKGSFDEFWHVIRPQQLQDNFMKIWDTSVRSSSPANFPLDGVFRMMGSISNKAVLQTLDSMSEWERFADIQQNGGYAVGFDLETFGDITRASTDPSQFGITEFAIGTRTYDGTDTIKSKGRSFIFGINDNQYKYLNELNAKFQKSGWHSLTDSEQVTLRRISMYAGPDAIKNEIINEYGNKIFKVAGVLSPETRTASAISAGIENLHKAYTESAYRPSELLETLMNELVSASTNENAVLYGANSKFDIDAIVNTAKTFGINTDKIQGLRNQVLDVVYSARALARSESQSVDQYFETMNGIKAGASVDEQLRSYRFGTTQIHQGYEDIQNEGRLLDARVQEIINAKTQLEDVRSDYQNYNGIHDSVFLINRGRLNQENAQEMGIVNGKPVSNYSFTNEFWTIDEERSRYIELNGENKYVLALNSYVDGDNTSIAIIRDTQEEAIEELTSNSSIFNTKQVTKSNALKQRAFKYKDFGRREFDKLISPSAVAMDNAEDIYGYESLKGYLNLVEKIPNELDIKADSESVNKLMAYIEEAYSDVEPNKKPVKSYYQAQAFVGMYEKIQNEKSLIDDIIREIDTRYASEQVTNIDRTIMFNRAYTNAINHMDGVYNRRKVAKTYNVMSDALGVDVQTPGGVVKRINAYSADSAASDFRRIFKNLSATEIGGIVGQMHSSGLIFADESEYNAVARRIATMSSSDLYGLSQDLGYELSKVTQEYINGSGSVVHAFGKSSTDKNLQFLGQKLEADMMIKYGNMTFAEAYSKSTNDINNIIYNAINNKPDTIYINTVNDNDAFKNYINKIASQLNIEQAVFEENSEKTSGNLLYELFTKTKGYNGTKTSYAINNYINDGLNTFLTIGDNGNAYLFLTRQEDAARFYANLLDGKFDLSSRQNLIDPKNKDSFLPIHDFASFIEIPKVNEYQLSNGTLRTINQGNIEKIIIPQLSVSTNSKGQTRAYYNSGEFEFLSTLRMSTGGVIKHALLGEYEAGTSAVRRAQNNYLDDLSSSASYRGRAILDANGNVIDVKRIAEFTPSDFIQAHEAKVGEGLYTLFKDVVEINSGKNLNTAQKIVKAFGEQSGIDFDPSNPFNYREVVNGSEFQEFFTKRLFTGTVANDTYLAGALSGAEFDKNLFQILKDIVNDGTVSNFDRSVAIALAKIPTGQIINQVLSESASEKGIVSFGVRPGDYNDSAPLYSTMRPTYHQLNNGMYFSLDKMDTTKFVGFGDRLPVRFNTAVITSQEYNDRKILSEPGYQPIPGQDYSNRRRSMVATIKQMNDYDLQLKYQEMHKNAKAVAEKIGISEGLYHSSLNYFQQNFMSLHEGKIFLAPGLNEQELFQDREGKKILYNLDEIDETRSRKLLNKYVHDKTRITRDTVIAIRPDGSPVYYQGPDTLFTKANVEEFFEAAKSYVIPIQGDIADNKIMIGGEKGTTHSIVMTNFKKYTGIQDDNEALRISNALFNEMFDGAAAVGNFGLEGHGNISSVHSIWSTISSQYIEKGYGEVLAGHLNRLINENDAFKGFGEFQFINGELISSSSNARNYSAAIEYLYNQIRTNSALRSDVNKAIVAELDYLNSHSLFNAVLQRQSMNEQMGTRMVIDQRLEQGMRTRGMRLGGDGMQAIDNDWADIMKAYSENYTAKGTSLTGELREFVNVFGANKNAERIRLTRGKSDIQRSAKGIVESTMYYYSPEKYSPEGKNIININVNDLMDEGIRLKGGLTTKELHNSIFFVDGKPSEFLQKHANGVDLYNDSYSIYIDLNQTKFDVTDTIDGKQVSRTFNGVMIPIQSVFGDINDKTYFQSQQKTVSRFINKLTNIIANPQDYKDGIESALSSSYTDLIQGLGKQLGFLDKDSDIYKAFQQYIMPTSQELLAQDEAAPIVAEMMDKETQSLIKRKNELESALIINADNKEAIIELDEIYSRLDTKLKNIGNQIRTNNDYYSELMSLSANKNLINASKVVINGQTHYGLAVAISEEAFERQGINIGAVGLEAFQNWETKNYQLEKIEKFSRDHDFGGRKITIAKKINDLGVEGLTIDSSGSITDQINAYVREQYKSNSSMLSIADLNKAMVENRDLTKVLQVFREEIGISYLSKIGTFGELTRYPSFRSQPMVRVILDKTLEGKQVRGSSAVLSSLTNVDFDGDKLFLAMLTDGISIVNRNTTILGKNVLGIQQKIFNRFATTESRGLLAELIEKGEAFEIDNPNAVTRQYAAMLKKTKSQAYKDAIMAWAKDNSIRVSSIDGLTKAQIYAASTSQQMHDAFINMEFNTMTDEDSILSSIAARFRKKGIGSISTPNYHMRNALLEAMQDPEISLEQKQLINDTYVSLSNMLSKAGGFFSLAEQKSIDVKHSEDGLNIARTARYSVGMNMLFGNSNHTVEKNIAGIRNILEATNSGLFKVSQKELNDMATLVATATTDEFNNAIKSYESSTQEHLKTLRKLLGVQVAIPNFDKIYANKLIKGTLDGDIFSVVRQIEKLNAGNFDELAKRYVGTGFYNVLDVFANSFSADKSNFIENNLYFYPGSINGSWLDKGYLFSNNEFTEIDITTGRMTGNKLKGKASMLIDGVPGGINVRDYMASSALRKQVRNTIETTKFERTLNSVLLDKNGNVLSKMPNNFVRISDIKGGRQKYGAVWDKVNNLFIGKQSQGRGTSAIYENINQLAKAYDYAVSKRFINTTDHPNSSGELIKQINKQIAENPKNHTGEFDTIFHNKLSSIFGGDEILDRYIKETQRTPNFNGKIYNESLDFLKQNTYDIIEQQDIISGSFASVQAELDGLRKQGVSDDELKILQDTLVSSTKTTNNLLNALRKENASVINKTQQTIYRMFDSTEQMKSFFGWDKVSNDSVVGFGNYIGKKFGDLSSEDINAIREAGNIAKSSIDSMSLKEQYALFNTIEALNNYKARSTTHAEIAVKTSKDVSELVSKNKDIVGSLHEKLNSRTSKQLEEAAERAGGLKKKTITGMSAAKAKDLFEKLPKKTIGIAAASLAAIGVVNNVLHNQKNKSPLTPARRPDGNTTPSYNSPATSETPIMAPFSKQKTVYHDSGSGFNFKVSASTRNYIDDQNNAKLIGMSGGGNPSVYSQSDTSGITDNWLANKFAELT